MAEPAIRTVDDLPVEWEVRRLAARLRALLPDLSERYGLDHAALFGSYVRNQQRAGSDLDVLVTLSRPLTLFEQVNLRDELADQLGVPVDIAVRGRLLPRIDRHIREAAERAREFVAGMSYEQFADDARTVYASVRALEIIGEAARRIPEDVRAMEPAIPWRAMAGMRDRMIHRYEEVDLSVVWGVLQQELPALFPALERLQQALEGREDEEWKRC